MLISCRNVFYAYQPRCRRPTPQETMNANKQDAAEELKDEPKMSPLEMEEGRTVQKAEPAKGKGAAALACMRK